MQAKKRNFPYELGRKTNTKPVKREESQSIDPWLFTEDFGY
jgi:hypothetical protein